MYAITGIQDEFPQPRVHLALAWQVDAKWQRAEPGRCRAVLSAPVLRAALCVAMLWGWVQWATVTMIGFAGMLRPGEFLTLRRQDLMLPRDTNFSVSALYVHLRNPKTARFARRQHVKISDPDIILFVDSLFSGLHLDAKLYSASPGAYKSQWNSIMKHLGLPHRQAEHGLTPGVLRGSGATHLYLQTEDISLIAWRGRWARVKTLEFYLQEVAAQVLLHSLSSAVRARIFYFEERCYGVFHHVLAAQ